MIQRLLLIVTTIAVAPPTGCGQAPTSSRPSEVFSLAGETMGTRYAARIVGLDTAHRALEQFQAAIDERLEQIEQRMSTWRNDSEVSRFNRHAETGWFAISPDAAQVIDTAIRIGRQSCGAFDVTVGRLVNLWQFGPGDLRQDSSSTMQPPERRNCGGPRGSGHRQDRGSVRSARGP